MSSKFVVVESHHEVLLAWAELRSTLSHAPRLITLDHHTDTSPPFRNSLKKCSKIEFEKIQQELISKIDFFKPETVKAAIQKLSNDEHIQTAIRSDIISSALVVAQNAMNTDNKCYQDNRIICREVSDENRDAVLESWLLQEAIDGFDTVLANCSEKRLLDGPYILDIDLDYLNSFKSIEPGDSFLIKALARKASLITIATEPEYVKSCAIDANLTSDYLLKRIIALLI